MSHKNKKSLYLQMCEEFESMFTPSVSKHEDKAKGITATRIYSYSTLNTYKKHCGYFTEYCKNNHSCKSLEECKPYIKEWISTRSDLSAYTVKMEESAVAKLYQLSTTDRVFFEPTRPRLRKDITRSRNSVQRDKHFSREKHKDIIEFCQSTGLRRKELSALKGKDLELRNGTYYVIVRRGKGGKPRAVPVIRFTDTVVRLMHSAGDSLVFPKVPNAMDVHSYRREYATYFYNMNCRSYSECIRTPFYNPERKRHDSNSVYRFRKDKAGTWYDKEAMLKVSRALGHNRISVVADHYIGA